MSEDAYYALRAAVTIARNEDTPTVAQLRCQMSGMFPPEVIQEALLFWADWANNRRSQ